MIVFIKELQDWNKIVKEIRLNISLKNLIDTRILFSALISKKSYIIIVK